MTGGSWPPEGSEAVELDGLYDRLAEWGFEYGPVFQGLRAVWRRGDEVFAEVSLLGDQQAQAGSFGVHPALLDSALHAGLSSLASGEAGEQSGMRLPFSFSDVELYASGASSVRVCLSLTGECAGSLVVADEAGGLVASVGSLALREFSPGQLSQAGEASSRSLFGMGWVPVLVSQECSMGEVVLFGEEGCVLAESLGGVGGSVGMCADLEALGVALDGGAVFPDAVFVDCGLGAVGAGVDGKEGSSGELGGLMLGHGGVQWVLALVQSWLSDERFAASRLVLLTRGAVAVRGGEGFSGLSWSPVWGLLRSAQSENPGRFVLVDIDADGASWGVLGGALASGESQLAIRQGEVLVPRLERVGGGVLVPPVGVGGWRLHAGVGGTFEDLSLVPFPEAVGPLEWGQVRVGVRAGGLNFRDVLIALGMYPGEAIVGGEGAGVVLELGPGVEGLAVGDRVMGLLDGLGPVSVADYRLVARVPEEWSFVQAASVPIAFLTAYYGLVGLAAVKKGERVLVHAGAGGVGMAAVQLARYLGAEVFATASPGKWGALRSLGVEESHIASSRTLEFRERFLEQTQGGGVDVVLDSLAREFVDASLELLPEGGRFVELGKADIRDSREVAEAYPGVFYRVLDLIDAGPEGIREMLGELLELFRAGVLRAATSHGVGYPSCLGGVPVHEPGTPYRQDRALHAVSHRS